MGNIGKWALVFLCAPIFSVLCNAAPKRTADATPAPSAAPNSQLVDCSSLTADEQQFAYGLLPENRAMFCGKFTDVQRAAAMQLTSQPDPTGAVVTPDQAVTKVAMANNLMPMKKSGGCPVK